MDFDTAVKEIKQIVGYNPDNVGQIVVDFLYNNFEHYNWVGLYLVQGNDLVLSSWKGPQATAHVRIPLGKGVCGTAATSGDTEIIDDVHADKRYIACFRTTRSEIVVPIKKRTRIIGEIDIDSDLPESFDMKDKVFLEEIANILSNFL